MKATIPVFNVPGATKGRWCKECPDKALDAIDIKSKRCGCLKASLNPVFNVPGTTRGRWCKECPDKAPEAIDVFHKRCGCVKATRPQFNVPGQTKGRWCKECPDKAPEAIDVMSKRCGCVNASLNPSFNIPGETKGRWCKECPDKAPEAIDVKHQRCGCVKAAQPVFNVPGETKGRWCAECPDKALDAIDVKSKRCTVCLKKRAWYGLAGHISHLCAGCKTPGTVPYPQRKCDECKELALYGEETRRRCEDHRLETDFNLVERPCTQCNLTSVLNHRDICSYCEPSLYLKYTKRKEKVIKDLLVVNDLVPTSQDQVAFDTTLCGRERPDFLFDMGTHVVILEVDEGQHKDRQCTCEQARMVNVTQGLGGLHVRWLRYNPDAFKLPSGRQSQVSDTRRHAHLLEWLRLSMKTVPATMLEIVYLYYDGCQDLVGADQIMNIEQI